MPKMGDLGLFIEKYKEKDFSFSYWAARLPSGPLTQAGLAQR
jgi:hypothetical protein